MGIPIEKSFVVKASPDAVWSFLTDPYKVARCLPGAAITEQVDEQTYGGTITVKVGPVTANYRGKMRFERLDPAAREADLAASGQETKGKGGADMRMKSRIVEHGPGESEVFVTSDVNVMGMLAQFGRGMIQDVSDAMFQRFTDGMRRELETPAAAAPPAASPTAAVPASPASQASPTGEPTTSQVTAGLDAPPAARPLPPSPATGAAGAAAVPAATAATAPPATAPTSDDSVLDVGSLGALAARRAAGRTLRRPAFWIVAVLLVVLIAWLFLR